jgi:hypothetical protein
MAFPTPPALLPGPEEVELNAWGTTNPAGWTQIEEGSWFVGNSIFTSVVAPREAMKKAATKAEDRQQTVAAAGALVPIVIGQDRVGGMIAAVVSDATYAYVLVVWCMGECDSIPTVTLNDKPANDSVTRTDHLGTAAQTVDTVLQAAYADAGVSYTDTLPNICYSVFVIPFRAYDGFPSFAAVIKGMKVKASAVATPAWSNVPAYAVAAYVESTLWGMGRAVDWASVATVAALNSASAIGEVRRTLNLTLQQPQFVDQWLPALCAYAGCWPIDDGGTIKLIPNAAAASEFTFTAANIVDGSMRLHKADLTDIPTVMRVQYTDTTVTPYRDGEAVVYAAGVLAGTTPWRESVVPMPGINRYSQALREATERLNLLTLCDLSAEFEVFDEALALQPGGRITVSHPIGLVAKEMRVNGISAKEAGRYAISAVEYDAAAYSDLVVSEPTTIDTPLPLPSNPPVLTGLTATEETYALDSGIFASRARIAWTAPTTFPFVRNYKVTLRVGTTEVHAALVDGQATGYATPPLQEGQTYTVEAAIISSVGTTGTAATTLVAIAGKAVIPGNVLTLTGFEVGGRVFLSWGRADNPTSPGTPDPDVWRYEVRRGTTAQAWADAGVVVLDQTDGLRLVDEGAPAGTWRYHVKAIDSVGQYSTTAKTLDITVTTDAAAFLVDSYDQTAPTLTNMVAYTLAPTDAHTYYITDDAVAFGTKFSSNLGTYGNALATYHNSVTSTWLGENADDWGSVLGGQWTGTADVTDIGGSHISYFGHSTDGSSWTYLSGLSQKVNARFARLKHEALTTSTMLVTVPTQNIRLDAIPRSETGTGTSSAAAAVTVTLANDYIATKKLTVTALGNTARMAVADNIVVGNPTTFDVYVFNDAGTKIASSFRYEFQGV